MADETQLKVNAGTVTPGSSNEKLLNEVIHLHEHCKGQRSGWDSHWQALAQYVQPRKAFITEDRTLSSPNGEKESQLFDSTAVQANMILASGHMSWMTPAESIWFSFDVPQQFADDDEVKGWFHRASLIAAMELGRSNFYTEVQEAYLDRGCFGTASFYTAESKAGGLMFRNDEIATYSVLENCEGRVDTHLRDFKLTYRQAVQEYGNQCSPKILEEMAKEPVKAGQREAEFIQAVFPRLERDDNNPSFMHKPFASVHIDKSNKHVCRVGGFDDFPYAVSRYLKWGRSPYGWAPSWMALPDMRQLNFLAKNLDLLTELKLFPRVLIPAGLKGEVDLRPGGITYMKEGLTADQQPKEWVTTGDIKEGMEREAQKREAINKAFHVDLFQMFAQMDRPAQMTAREVAERASEKLIQFSPTFARLTTEFYEPMLRRVFRLLFNMRKFPPPPRQMFQVVGNSYMISEPQVQFSSRVATAMKQLENVGFMRTMDGLSAVASIRPEILDHYDWNKIARDLARNDGLPESWLLPAQQVAQMQADRAQRQAQMEQAQIAESVAGAAGKLATAPPGSPVAQMVEQGMKPGMPGLPAAA